MEFIEVFLENIERQVVTILLAMGILRHRRGGERFTRCLVMAVPYVDHFTVVRPRT